MRRVVVRRSSVHGRGVFAVRQLQVGECIFEYKGEVTTWRKAVRRYESRSDESHTFLFGLSDGRVIDGARGGNSARWLNHACAPNCETVEIDGRVFIHAARDIRIGDELFIDYALEVEESATDDDRAAYRCRCGGPACRGTMLGGTAERT
ncbi:SET domain-containing protein [Burkholderia guangdongensis]|uniref:SET domain-containing protein n=1 Tax=Burkholderia guangdongensis TaxID=1792500 RepID=UPI0015CA72DC|nr:SET domain-containing protein-lysine N-methyltransferase [Burkholderia guangdongensis]